MRKLLLTICLMLAWVLPSGAAAIGEQTMTNLTLGDGLSGETVNHVITDHLGYTWIATTGGVSVFDGKHLMNMRLTDDKGRWLAVSCLCKTRSHGIYAATRAGLYQLTHDGGRFTRVLPEVENPQTLLAVGDTVYIGGEQGLQVYDGSHLKQTDVSVGRKGLDNIVRHYAIDDHDAVWFLGRYSLNRYDPKTGKVDSHDLTTPSRQPGEAGSCMAGKVLSQFDITGTRVWIGTRDGGLFVYDVTTRTAHHVEGVGNIVTSVRRSRDGLVAVATDGTGGYLIDTETERVVEHFSSDATGMHRLPTNALYSFYRDDRGINWLGTVRHGLVYEPYSSGLFLPYTPDGMTTLGMNVRSFLLHGSQTVIGLQDGMWLVDASQHTRRYFTPDELGGHIVNNLCWWQGSYVVGLYDGGVRLLDGRSGTLSRQQWSPLLNDANVGAIEVAPDSSLWIGCSDGLFIIRRDGSVQHLTEQNSKITGGIIIDITFDAEGNAWLSGAKGLSVYSCASREVVDANFPSDFFHREGYMRGMRSHDSLIYMRNGPQLFYTTSRMERYGEVTLPVSLTDRWCRAMADDMQGRLWLASERGLLGIGYDGHNLIQIGEGEGLRGSQVNDLRLDGDGRLWVATSQGLFSTSLQELTRMQHHAGAPITLYTIRCGSDLLSNMEMADVTEHHRIRLTWNLTSQVLQAEPLLLDYASQQGRSYEYRVDGGPWQLIDAGQSLDVRRLFLGSHTLTIRLSGVKGTKTSYTLSVVPSVMAIVEFILLITALVLLWLWWRYRKRTNVLLSERNEIEEALVESEQLRAEVEELRVETEEPKYQKVKIDEAECADIVSRMKEYIERERVYVNQELKMKDLADVMHLSAPKLSQVFNLYLQTTYYDFINQYRLDEFKRLVEAGELKRYTITALSEQCGFRKSNFFSTFRKVEGMTPAEYLKKHGF